MNAKLSQPMSALPRKDPSETPQLLCEFHVSLSLQWLKVSSDPRKRKLDLKLTYRLRGIVEIVFMAGPEPFMAFIIDWRDVSINSLEIMLLNVKKMKSIAMLVPIPLI